MRASRVHSKTRKLIMLDGHEPNAGCILMLTLEVLARFEKTKPARASSRLFLQKREVRRALRFEPR